MKNNIERKIKKIGKHLLHKEKYKKIKKLDKNEQGDVLKHAIDSYLDLKKLETELKVIKAKEKQDVFFAETKLIMLEPKIELFKLTYEKKDLKNILNLIGDIERELEYV